MARGDMLGENLTFGASVEILNRPPYRAVSMTIDFSEAAENGKFKKDADTGELYVPAGMPIDKKGKPVHETPYTDVVGILLVNVYQHRPQGAVVTEGYINKERAEASIGTSYASDLISALVNAGCRIRIEGDDDTDILIGTISSGE